MTWRGAEISIQNFYSVLSAYLSLRLFGNPSGQGPVYKDLGKYWLMCLWAEEVFPLVLTRLVMFSV
jgi:hypothetical protein